MEPSTLSPPSAGAADAPALHAHELEALRRLAADAFGTVHPDEVFAAVCARLRPLLGADFLAASLRPFGGKRQWCADGGEPDADAAARLSLLLARARDGGESLVVADAPGGGADGGRHLAPSAGLAAAVAVPLRAGGEVLGALAAGWSAAPLPPRAARVAEAAAELAAAAFRNAARFDEVQQAAVRRDRFFSAMSHDLRTPITAIVGYSELLQDGIFGELQEKQQEMIDRICLVSGQLTQLLADVMDVAKLDAGRMEFHRQPVSLGALVDQAVGTVEEQASAKGLAVEVELGDDDRAVGLRVDPPRVHQILVHLLTNAVRLTEAGHVRVRTGREGGRRWLEVRDTGPGLPAGSEEAVFEEFMRTAAVPRDKRHPGAGLGLALSRRLARAMGGDLVARGLPGEGASFTLLLPADSEGA